MFGLGHADCVYRHGVRIDLLVGKGTMGEDQIVGLGSANGAAHTGHKSHTTSHDRVHSYGARGRNGN